MNIKLNFNWLINIYKKVIMKNQAIMFMANKMSPKNLATQLTGCMNTSPQSYGHATKKKQVIKSKGQTKSSDIQVDCHGEI